MIKRHSLILLLFLAGCATATPYQPAGVLGKGYADQILDKDKARVSFSGNKLTERTTVETYLFYRAAELTIERGFRYFTMTQLHTDRQTEVESIAPVVYGYYVQDRRRFPYYVYGFPMAPQGGTVTHHEYEAVAYVSMVKERSDSQQQSYYDAEEVLKNLKEEIKRPKK